MVNLPSASNGEILFFIETARKPRAFKLGDEWLPGAEPAEAGEAEVSFGIIWPWPDIGQGHTRSIGCRYTWYGYRNTGGGCCEAK